MLWSPSYRFSLSRLLERARVRLSSHATIPKTLRRSQHFPARERRTVGHPVLRPVGFIMVSRSHESLQSVTAARWRPNREELDADRRSRTNRGSAKWCGRKPTGTDSGVASAYAFAMEIIVRKQTLSVVVATALLATACSG